MARRQRVDLEAAQYVQVLDALPMHANRAATDFISYPSTNFKHSPKWQHCSKYKPAVAKLFEFSGGKNANQNYFSAAAKQYSLDHSLGLTPDAIEQGIYRFRTLVSQLINHKAKGRTIPKQWQRLWQTLYDSIDVETNAVEDEDANADILYVGPVETPEAVVIDLTSELAEDDLYYANILKSDDPVLQQLLSGEQKGGREVAQQNSEAGNRRRRRSSKQPEHPLSKTIGGMDTTTLQSLISEPANRVSPKAWATLNASLKKKTGKKGGRKKKGGDKPKQKKVKNTDANKGKKTSKGNKPSDGEAVTKISFTTYCKRKHSNAWHAKFKEAEAAGKPTATAQQLASEAARKVTADLRADRDAKRLPDWVIP